MDYRRTIKTVSVEGYGEVHLKGMSAALKMRLADIAENGDSETKRNIRIMAEVLAECLVDSSGQRVFADVKTVMDEMDIDAFNAISSEIVRQSTTDESKNSQSVQT